MKNRPKTDGKSRPSAADRTAAQPKNRAPRFNDHADHTPPLPEGLIVGKNAVAEAVKSGIGINRLLVAKGGGFSPELIAAAKEKGAAVEYVERAALDKTAVGYKHQGVAAYVAPVPFATLDEVLANAEKSGEPPLLVLLDEIEDPHNLGAILRSAEAAGAHGVLLPKRRAAAVGATAAKTSAGAIFHIPLVKIGNVAQTLRELKDRGLWIFGADAAGEQTYDTADWTRAAVLIIGNEGKGINRLVREQCDFLVKIPMRGQVNSLNASAAAAILLFAAVSERNKI